MAVVPIDYGDTAEALVVGLARSGDRDAFADLVRRRQSWIRNLMRRWCADPTLADDLAQQVFLQAWRRIDQLDQADKFAAWLKRLAVNIWLQHLRKNDALRSAEEYSDKTDATGPPPQAVGGMAVDLDRALATLSAPARLCLVLSYSEGMTNGEIATLTGLALGTVKSHIRRGTQRLRELLSAYQEPPPGTIPPRTIQAEAEP